MSWMNSSVRLRIKIADRVQNVCFFLPHYLNLNGQSFRVNVPVPSAGTLVIFFNDYDNSIALRNEFPVTGDNIISDICTAK